MLLSIVIPTHRRPFQVERLLDSILQQNFPQENLEILLVSNFKSSSLRDKLPQWEKQFLRFKYKEVGLKGVNKARNMGIRFARGEILYFLDDDCVLAHNNHLNKVIQAHKKHSAIAGIGGAYKNITLLPGFDKFYHENTESWLSQSVRSDNHTSQLLGGNASYKRHIFDKGYYFDPRIVFGGSEISFNDSIKDYGLLFDESLWVYHCLAVGGFSFIKKSFQQGKGSFTNSSENKMSWSFDKEWAFSHGDNASYYSFLYQFFFKMGRFWGYSSSKNLFVKTIQFLFFIFKSRLYYMLRVGGISRLYGKALWLYGWLYGRLLLPLYYMLRRLLLPLYYMLRVGISRLYGKALWLYGWLYGRLLLPLYYMLRRLLLPLYYMLRVGISRLYGKALWLYGWLYGRLLLPLYYMLRRLLLPLYYMLRVGISRLYGKALWLYGWLYGRLLLPLYYMLRRLLLPLYYMLRVGISRLYGKALWLYGWLYGRLLLPLYYMLRRLLLPLYYMLRVGISRLYGKALWLYGWLYGRLLLPLYYMLRRLLLPLYYMLRVGISRLYGKALWLYGWLYGKVFLPLYYMLRVGISRLYGKMLWLYGWLYGRVLLPLFYHSPPMKLYYFSRYQYYKRISPIFLKKNNNKKAG